MSGLPLRKPRDLVSAGLASPEEVEALQAVTDRYPMAVAPGMVAAMADEGVRRQFVPSLREQQVAPEERADPIGDTPFSPVEGLVHRYPDRVLLLPTLLCPVYCRFCFRREVVGDPERGVLSPERVEAALVYLREHPGVREVILTGGDPLVLSPQRIGALVSALATIPHLRVLRVHTRVPLVAPERIGPALLAALRSRLATWVVLHTNHPAEFTPEGVAACAALVDAGFPMLSQSVLLRGVNDRYETLAALMQTAVDNRIKPYYLHHLDLAEGTGHFRVSLAEGAALVAALRGNLSGLCQPTYVLDIPGGHGKVPVGPSYLHGGPRSYTVEDPWGGLHAYEDLEGR